MSIDTPEGIGGSLSIAEAATAYANPTTEEETPEGHPESEQVNEEEDVIEGEEPEGDEPDDEGHANEEEPAEPEAIFADAQAKVKLPNGEETTVHELIRGNLRDQDYRQKTEAVASERKALTAKSESVAQLEQQISADRQYMAELLQALMPPKPDANLASVDPVGYVEAKARYESFSEHANYLLGQQQQAQQRREAEANEERKGLLAREWEATLREMPELKDAKRLNSFVNDINQHGTQYGFTSIELQGTAGDHRQLLVLRDAIAWRKLQASKPKAQAKVENRPPVQRGGTRNSPGQQQGRDVRVAMDRLQKSGSLRDGVAALLATEKG